VGEVGGDAGQGEGGLLSPPRASRSMLTNHRLCSLAKFEVRRLTATAYHTRLPLI
jgi:hypothetical protein